MRKAVFIDKDGTLITDIPYNTDPNLISLQENSIEGLIRLQEQGYLLIIISNQAGVAKGIFKEEALEAVFAKVKDLLAEQNITLDASYYCPHHPEGTVEGFNKECCCRKPFPGMILKAAKDFNVDLEHSWMIGDILNDVEAGNRAGCRTILLDNNNETEWYINEFRKPDFVVESLNEAAECILKPVKTFEKYERGIS